MKNAVRNILSSVFIFLAGCLTLITCADPMSGVNVIGNGGGIITVTIGGSNARTTLSWANTLDSEGLSHTITVSGGPGKPPPPYTIAAGQAGTATFSVTPGLWTITVEGKLPSGEVVAFASVTKQINMGNNGTFPIKMDKPDGYPVIDVTFDANGGGFDGELEKIQSVNKYSRVTWPEPDPVLEGKYFIGWHTDSVCTDDNEYNFHTAVTVEKTLYARWSDVAPFTVTFDKNHSDNEGYTEADPPIKHVLPGGKVTLPIEPTRIGYTFAGWLTQRGAAFTDETSVTDDITVYAQWTANNLVNAEPPVITVQPSAINEIYNGDTIELTVSATPPTSSGSLTYQWYKKANAQDNDGTPLGTENGAATAIYKTPTSLDVGTYYYYCVVTNTDTSVNGNHTAPVTSGTAKVIVYGVGSGTKPDPFIVHNVETLERVGKGKGEWAGWSLSAYYLQIKNIELPDPDPGESNWTPIGRTIGFEIPGDPDDPDDPGISIPEDSFTGSYDGNGKTISNLKIYAPSSDYWHPQGLFGGISNSTVAVENIGIVKNVGIVDCDIIGGSNSGGVVGWNIGMVQNCYVTGNVSGNYPVGGVVGSNGGTVQYCYATGNVSGGGGVVGDNSGMVQYCYATGNVSGDTIGGVVGGNSGTVKNCYSTGDVSGTGPVGGVVGSTEGSIVQNCYATGNVSGNGSVSGGNGVAGFGSDKIANCVALNPSIAGTYRVSGITNTTGSLTIISGYARGDMLVKGTTKPCNESSFADGADITSSDWSDENWWTGTAKFNETETAWDFTGINGTNLPKLKGMPGGTEAQNPVIK